MGRRDQNDIQWKKVKDIVRKRDKNICRLIRILSIQEGFLLKKNAPFEFLNKLDPAHYLPVGQYPEECYNEDNIVLLNRYSHSMLDSFKNPLNGKNISKEEVNKWWKRILENDKRQYDNLIEKGLI